MANGKADKELTMTALACHIGGPICLNPGQMKFKGCALRYNRRIFTREKKNIATYQGKTKAP